MYSNAILKVILFVEGYFVYFISASQTNCGGKTRIKKYFYVSITSRSCHGREIIFDFLKNVSTVFFEKKYSWNILKKILFYNLHDFSPTLNHTDKIFFTVLNHMKLFLQLFENYLSWYFLSAHPRHENHKIYSNVYSNLNFYLSSSKS